MTDINHWYIKKGRGQIQQSWYLLFVKRKGIKLEVLVSLLDEWGQLKMFTQGTWKGSESQRKTTMDNIRVYWQDFLVFITSKTGVEFKKRVHKKRYKSYEDWWERSNLDGTFAYNNVTDDF